MEIKIKLPYERPLIIDLSGGQAYAASPPGPCKTGGSPGTTCTSGGTAYGGQCQNGSVASSGACQKGSSPASNSCKKGSFATNQCSTGNAH
jgi:hypothetical protein